MAKAIFNGVVIAESDKTQIVEGNHYFPPESVNMEYFVDSAKQLSTVCPWKGVANYFDVTVNGETLSDVAWRYENPKPAAERITNHIAFYKSRVTIEN